MEVEESEAGPQQGGAKHARQAAVEETAAAPQAAARPPNACRILVGLVLTMLGLIQAESYTLVWAPGCMLLR